MKKILIVMLLTTIGRFQNAQAQNIGINANGALPDSKAMLDVSSTNSGLLIPRMTTAQRDSILLPPNALQIFNTTTKALNIYNNSRWETITPRASTNNIVNVYSLSDLPAPVGSGITLDATKMYIFSGIVDISPNYLVLNGAGLRGIDPEKDGIMSSVSGGILRSTAVNVFMESLAVIPISASTKAYDFADATGTKFCNIFSGCSVVEIGIPSLGVGQISGFKAITIVKNYWKSTDGIKVTGTVGKFASTLNFITGITTGSAIEFLAGATIDDIDLANNYFIYTGQTGVKVNGGAVIDRGRMTSNMFRGVSTLLNGFDSYTPGWQMVSNTGIPNSRAFAFQHLTGNVTATSLPVANTFYKIAGTTTTIDSKKFSSTSNRLTYIGKTDIVGKVNIIIGAKSPTTNGDFSIAIAKNGVTIAAPLGTMSGLANNQSFQISFITELDLSKNDYVEVFIRTNNTNTNTIVIEQMQFRVTD